MDNSESVKVYARLRPAAIWEVNSPAKSYLDLQNSTDQMLILDSQPFLFDHIFYQHATQDDVFRKMMELNIDRVIDGFNCSVLAYGQSGAGKTYSMGLNDKQTAGMIKLSINSLLTKISDKTKSSAIEWSVSVSFVEIYNEKVFDLLSDKYQESIYQKGAKFSRSTQIPIKDSDDALQILSQGNKNRHVRSTVINSTSSRSHAMFTIFVSIKGENSETEASLAMVDLAGSEGLRNTNHSGIAQQEGVNINQGLLSVGKVIQALSNGKKLIPYRDSVLTVVLQESLNTNSFLSLLACISPARKDKSETLSTIRFSQSVKTLVSKNHPEVSKYLKEKQRQREKTPMKPYMLPFARSDLSIIGKNKTPAKTSVAKTPGSVLPTGRYTGRIEKQPLRSANRNRSFNTSSKRNTTLSKRSTNLPLTRELNYLDQCEQSGIPQQSMENNTFSIMNCSASTEIDAPNCFPSLMQQQQQQPMSFSPLMRQIEQTINNKFESFMETLKNQTTAVPNMTLFRSNVKNAVAEQLDEAAGFTTAENNSDFSLLNSTFNLENPVCSTVARNPASSNVQRVSKSKAILGKIILSQTVIEVNSTAGNSEHDFVAPLPPKRRTHRRATTIDQTINGSDNETVLSAQPTRRSARISLLQTTREDKDKMDTNSISEAKTIVREQRKTKTKINNSFLASYFNNSSSKKVSKLSHKNAVLDLLNNGTMKDLQVLPTVGLKTSYQIVTYRTMNGKFKSIDDLKKLTNMKGKTWEKFLASNLII